MSNKKIEKEFKKRYNREPEISYEQKRNGKELTVTVTFKYKKREFQLVDNMVDGATVSSYMIDGDKKHKYNSYIFSEIHLADKLGEIDNGSSN